MSKDTILSKIDSVLLYFHNNSEPMAKTIYDKYFILNSCIENDNLKYNLINGSVRAYLDAFNDWDNPILNIMSELEKNVALMIESNS